ncbi:unnamed protein product [Cyclocybe aegerita]|uniref:HSF-type DNA-binding domain-containing protein n=1 Tax=Cyclocybe aegerita TaxID=1973307 RepID=A0A8S0W6V6_CYCAE|nr:unnamed protein product [Cyclocybe aegerita]
MNTTDQHYRQHPHHHHQHQQQHQQHWPPHLLHPQQHYHHQLSLNLDSLSVTSPTNLSPINPPTAAISPVTPPFQQHQHQQHPFSFDPVQQPGQQSPGHYDEHGILQQPVAAAQGTGTPYDTRRTSTAAPSRASSSGGGGGGPSSQLPRKRSFTAHPNASSTSLGSNSPGGGVGPSSASAPPSASSSGGPGAGLTVNVNVGSTLVEESIAGGGSPVDGSGSTSGAEDSFGMIGMGGSMNILGKPMATNNFVTKLYQMINDPKSAQFIAWTELGTSFVVSNVGEFSRSILGSHFKHNNFSSFVRQLNMYGFHKINRTPRAQRTSTDAQTWEFSHHKFLRGRPDLLDEIKRKALEPDPGMKHRVELPGEVAAQLNAMRDENRRVWDQLNAERRKVEKLVNVVGRLWDVVGKGFPGSVPQFPQELLESSESPNIYITSPTATSRFPPPLSMNLHAIHNLNSPSSSPTTADFPSHSHHQHPHSLSRQHSFQHVAGSNYRGESTSSTPLPSSPGSGSISMDMFDDGSCDPPPPSGRNSAKRQRLDDSSLGINVNMGSMGGVNVNGDSMSMMSSVSSPGSGPGGGLANLTVPKKSSRARSDSAPMGYAHVSSGLGSMASWSQPNGIGSGGVVGRPRSGSGMMPRGIPNIGTMTRNSNASTPLLSITTAESDLNSR